MGNAGRTGGQYYTPRPLINNCKINKSKINETIYVVLVEVVAF